MSFFSFDTFPRSSNLVNRYCFYPPKLFPLSLYLRSYTTGIPTSSITLARQYSELPLKRAGAKNLVSCSGETPNTSTPPDTDFSDAQATELLGKPPQANLLNAKV